MENMLKNGEQRHLVGVVALYATNKTLYAVRRGADTNAAPVAAA